MGMRQLHGRSSLRPEEAACERIHRARGVRTPGDDGATAGPRRCRNVPAKGRVAGRGERSAPISRDCCAKALDDSPTKASLWPVFAMYVVLWLHTFRR